MALNHLRDLSNSFAEQGNTTLATAISNIRSHMKESDYLDKALATLTTNDLINMAMAPPPPKTPTNIEILSDSDNDDTPPPPPPPPTQQKPAEINELETHLAFVLKEIKKLRRLKADGHSNVTTALINQYKNIARRTLKELNSLRASTSSPPPPPTKQQVLSKINEFEALLILQLKQLRKDKKKVKQVGGQPETIATINRLKDSTRKLLQKMAILRANVEMEYSDSDSNSDSNSDIDMNNGSDIDSNNDSDSNSDMDDSKPSESSIIREFFKRISKPTPTPTKPLIRRIKPHQPKPKYYNALHERLLSREAPKSGVDDIFALIMEFLPVKDKMEYLMHFHGVRIASDSMFIPFVARPSDYHILNNIPCADRYARHMRGRGGTSLARSKFFYTAPVRNNCKTGRERPVYTWHNMVWMVINEYRNINEHPLIQYYVEQLSQAFGVQFNHVIGTRYESEVDNISWHDDDPSTLEPNTPIVSLSFGASRDFSLCANADGHYVNNYFKPVSPDKVIQVHMVPGSAFVLGPDTNRNYNHAVLPVDHICQPRISLVFRCVKYMPVIKLIEKMKPLREKIKNEGEEGKRLDDLKRQHLRERDEQKLIEHREKMVRKEEKKREKEEKAAAQQREMEQKAAAKEAKKREKDEKAAAKAAKRK